MGVTISGTYSGLNVNAIIQAIVAADSIPITNLQNTDTDITNQNSDLGSLGSSLGNLSTQLQNLGSNSLFASKLATVATASVGTASVDSTTAQSGSTTVNIQKLATNTVLTGGSATGGAYTDSKVTAPPAGSTLLNQVLHESTIQGQTLTINGQQITLADTDVLDDGNPNSTQSVIGKINNSGAGVTASYNSTTGAVSLTSASSRPIILGSASDTSDFIHQAQLFNNGGTSVSSVTGMGRIDPTADLATAGLRTNLTAGAFSINGVSINYTAGDSLNTLMGNINASKAGVTASYDTYQDQIVLTSNNRGPQNITVVDGTSNVASALRLTAADSQTAQGSSTLFTVGTSPTVRQSDSNVLTSSDLGIPGLTFTATGTGSTQVTVASDTTTIANTINAFIDQYNSTQNVINSYTHKDTTDPTKNGSLANVTALTFLPSTLRSTMTNSISTTATIRMLSDLGITSNANDNTLTHVDSTKLQAALTNHTDEVQALFNDPTKGLVNTVQTVISNYNDSLNGVITNLKSSNSKQITYNQTNITRMQEIMNAETKMLQKEFAALDSASSSSQALNAVITGNSSTSSVTSSAGSVGTTAN